MMVAMPLMMPRLRLGRSKRPEAQDHRQREKSSLKSFHNSKHWIVSHAAVSVSKWNADAHDTSQPARHAPSVCVRPSSL